MKEKPTSLEPMPLETPGVTFELEFRLTQSESLATIARETTRMSFDVFI
jgi:hypothetical protein